MYFLDLVLEAFFNAWGGYQFFLFVLSTIIVISISAALVRPFIGDI
jgi:hypothetical protein